MTDFIASFKNKAKEYDVISFDIFDTLVTRTVPDPLMVFDIVENKAKKKGISLDNFRRHRWVAQLERGISNANIYEIYEQLQQMTGITDGQRDYLYKLEIDTEKEVLVRREDVCLCFKWALEAGKRIFLVSDMYLPEIILIEMLDNLGISGYEALLVSCDYRKLKSEGLFQELIEKVGKDARILHIGDNEFGDGECAKKEGIATFHIDSGIMEFKRLLCKDEKTSEWRYSKEMHYLGKRIAMLYNSPLMKLTKRNDMFYILGYFFVAPFMFNLTEWIINEAVRNGCDGVLFSARDGYVPYMIYQKICRRKELKIQCKYFYISRKAAVACNSDNNDVLNFLVNSSWPELSEDEILKEKFCLPDEMITSFDFFKYGDDIFRYIWDHYKRIETNAKTLRKNYLRYMGNIGLIIGRKYALYDFISSGTCQKAVEMFAPFELVGNYAYSRDEEGYNITSYLKEDNGWFFDNYKLFETMLLSPEPSLHGFDEYGNPVFESEKRSKAELDSMNLVQEGIMDFTEECLNAGYNCVEIDKELSIGILNMVRLLDIDKMQNLVVYDDWNNK